MKTFKSVLLVIIINGWVLISCSKKNEETISQATTCDTFDMNYSTDVQPILQANCYGCHGNGLTQNGIGLDSYDKVKVVANNGKLVGATTHAPGFTPMPKGGAKLSDCNINKIKAWVNSGAPNN